MGVEILNAAPWIIVDPNAYLIHPAVTPAGSRVNTDLTVPADGDVFTANYKDGGAGQWSPNTGFTHLFTVQGTDTTGNGKAYCMYYSNTIEDPRANKNGTAIGCGVLLQSDGGGAYDMGVFTDGSNTKGNGVAGAFNELTTVYGEVVVDANNFTCNIYSDAARLTQIATDTVAHGGSEPTGAGQGYQYLFGLTTENRGSTGREWGLDVWDIDLQEVPPGPPTEIRVKMNIDATTVHPNGTTVLCYDAANNLELTGNVGSITGADTGNPAIVAPAAGEAVFTFPNADLAQRWFAIDPAVNVNGAQSNLKTPVQLV